jgi:hypothetical protein
MGFGSYDESEQRNQETTVEDDAEGVTVRENDHEGELRFESGASTTDLVDRLETMRDDETDEE